MFAWLFLWLVLLVQLAAGTFGYGFWKRRRRPARHRRWWALGAGTSALGYAHTLAYGFALTRPAEICGQRTLDDDYPLTHTRVDVFPPAFECHWTDSSAYGPSHPTAAGVWLLWCGAALLVAGTAARATSLPSPAPRWARAGVILAPAAAAVLWVIRIAPLMGLPEADLGNECFRWQLARLNSAPSGEITGTDRGLLPPAVDCVFTDGTVNLVRTEAFALSCCLAVFLLCCAALRPPKSP